MLKIERCEVCGHDHHGKCVGYRNTYRVIDRTAPFGVRSQEYDSLAMAHAVFMQLVAQKKACCIRSWPMFEKIEEYIPD